MTRTRYDETWHRLREWTKGQAPSERLAAQILLHEGYSSLDPSHPLGGRDGGKDAVASKDGVQFAMAVYFPRGQQRFETIKEKFEHDLAGVRGNSAVGIAFVTNQEMRLSEREEIKSLAGPAIAEIYHLERVTAILDTPAMAQVREQFLDIESDRPSVTHLGGRGGAAPGAGGGGGGAMGGHATGGAGGPGGDIVNLKGASGKAPGAGGGGAGAIGEGAVGGEGGGGGEHLSLMLGPDDIGPNTGFHHFEIQVGEAGRDGGPGEDTIVNLCDEDGHVLRSIVAKGGRSGAPAYVKPMSRLPTDEDLRAGLRVTGMIAAEFIRIKAGLITMLDGGWDFWTANSNPFRLELPILIEVETGTIPPGTILELKLSVKNPGDFKCMSKRKASRSATGRSGDRGSQRC